jgi:hypothetical protein
MAKYYNYSTIETDDWNVDVEVEADGGYDGIGSYEFWGFKGYDKGHFNLDIEEIKPQFAGETEEEKKVILKYIEDNFDTLAKKFEENWDFPEPDEPPDRD